MAHKPIFLTSTLAILVVAVLGAAAPSDVTAAMKPSFDVVPAAHDDNDPSASTAPALVVEVDPTALLEELRQTGHVTIPTAGLPLRVEMREVDLRAPGALAVLRNADGTTTATPLEPLGTYRARLEGQVAFASPVTLVPGYLSAILVLDECRHVAIETLSGQADGPGPLRAEVWEETCAGSADGGSPGEDSTDGPGCAPPAILAATFQDVPTCDVGLIGVSVEEENLGAAVGWSRPTTTKTLNIITDSDTNFFNAGTSSWTSRQATVVNNFESLIYDAQLNVQFSIVSQWTYTSAGPTMTACSGTGGVLAHFKSIWQADTTSRDTVLALYERNLSGDTVGCGYEPGVNDPANWGYAVVQTDARSSTEEYKTGGHEVGHNLYGRHTYGDKWWSWRCFCTKGTIMATDMKTANKINEFTEGDDTDYTKNAPRIRYCAANKSSCGSIGP